jgi:hypothetical protein
MRERRRVGLAAEREARAAAEAKPWERLRPAERIARLMNLGDTRNGEPDAWHWRTVAEILDERAILNERMRLRWYLNGLILTAYNRLVSAFRASSRSKLSVWTVRNGPQSTITVWLNRQTQILFATRTGPRPRRRRILPPSEALAELFLAASGNVLRCSECGRWFARASGKQKACTATCADRARKRRLRGGRRREDVQRANHARVGAAEYGHGYFETTSPWIGGSTSWDARWEAKCAAVEAAGPSTMGPARNVPLRFERPRLRSYRTPRRT